MALPWAERRQTLYYIVGFIILVILLAVAWRVLFYRVPMCTDSIQNGTETGVDCGGVCAALCPNTAKAPSILWARSFPTAPQIYTAAAYIQNNNVSQGAGAKQVHYSFQILDSNNVLIVERDGVIDLPPQQTIPIVESGINVGTRTPARTFFSFDDAPMAWKKIDPSSMQNLRIAETSPYQNNRLSATVANDSFDDAKKVTLVAVLFDSGGVARAASKSTLAKIGSRSQESVTFTWPDTVQDIARAEVTILPSF